MLERRLQELDDWDADQGDPDMRLRCRQDDLLYHDKDKMPTGFHFDRTRPRILEELREKLMQYGGLPKRCKQRLLSTVIYR